MWTSTSEGAETDAAGERHAAARYDYLRAVAPYQALEQARDALLAPIDTGARACLTPDERACLEGLDGALRHCLAAVQAAEPGLVAAGQCRLRHFPDLPDTDPALALLLGPIPPGRWESVVGLAERLLGRLGPEGGITTDEMA